MVNVTHTHQLFPTLVQEFIHEADEDLKSNIKNQDVIRFKKSHTCSSKNNNLHLEPEFKGFVNKVISTTKDIIEVYQWSYDKLEITNMWINISQKGDAHMPHSHSNNIFSGVWYPFKNKVTPIFFYDPRNVANFWCPKKTKDNCHNSNIWSFHNRQSMGLIFPAWLVHCVPPADDTRISISWNMLVRGDYGEPNALQNAHI
tara:strand:+ start:794 stop:1396 length:603 start_codon:yes stop_codon:yes gene_type:complete